MSDAIRVPVALGCCPPGGLRCLLCDASEPVSPETISALVEVYRARDPAASVEVCFFGGDPPSPAQVEAAGGHPLSVRVRPDRLSRADAARLAGAGCHEVELDALSWHDPALREAERPYRASLLAEMSAGLPALGLAVGGVLAPGLPRSDHPIAVDDARRAVQAGWRFVRLHPVLVVDGSGLARLHAEGRYDPLTRSEAITVLRDQLDVLEAADTPVRRVGQQPGPDEVGRVVAGPVHPALRELVETRRVLDRLHARLAEVAPGSAVVIRCAPADETRVRGPSNGSLRTLRIDHDLSSVVVQPDAALARGRLVVEADRAPPA